MTDDSLTMEGVEAIDLTGTDNAKAEDNAPEAAETEPRGEEGATSFVDAFAKALDGGDSDAPAKESADPEPVTEAGNAEPEDSKESSRSASDFKKIKSDRDEAHKELTELKAKLADLENSDVDQVLADLKTERDDLSQRLKLAAIERHPKFQQEFEEKISSISNQAKRVVGGDNAERIAELLSMADSDFRNNGIEEVMMELSTSKQAQLGSLIAQADGVRYERETALENANETYNEIVKEQQAQREASMAESMKLFDSVAEEAANIEVFSTRNDDDDWNNEVKQRVEAARGIFSGENDAKELARASLWAAAAPKYRQLLADQIELNRRLRAQLDGVGDANPSMSGGGESSPGKPKSFAEAYMEAMGS